MRASRLVAVAALAIAAALAACILNPQPLPPGTEDAPGATPGEGDRIGGIDGSADVGPLADPSVQDSAAPTATPNDAGDAGDASDGADASDAGDAEAG